MRRYWVLVVVAAFLSSATAYAHSGGTDANGCHKNHKTGGYHCH
ncbi:MAG: YHYH domain-containing protein [Alphaproteobacteria bacterium]|nr:YHYH domain-containing protein [Alphaproteobacteria bacterium]